MTTPDHLVADNVLDLLCALGPLYLDDIQERLVRDSSELAYGGLFRERRECEQITRVCKGLWHNSIVAVQQKDAGAVPRLELAAEAA